MDFGLSQEQILLKDTVKRFLTEQCPTTRVRTVMESASGHDEKLWAGLMELGIGGLVVPAAYGGLERELLDLALVAEELGYAAAPGPFLGSAMAVVALAAGGDAAQREKWLTRLATGEAIGAVALGEDDAEWNPERFQTSVKGGRASGTKPLVLGAAVADFILVAAKDEKGSAGFWLVERGAGNLHIEPAKGNDMTRRLDRVELRDTPATPLPGAAALPRTIDAGLILLAADAYGGSRRCLDMARTYALQREQFGQPIGAFQAVKHQLANLVTEIEPCLSLYWYAAHAFDRIQEQSVRHAALAKAHLCDVFDRTARDTTELHGGIGFTWEFDLHLWFRRAIFDRGYLGDSTYHRARAADLAGW
jgi:alkylation response protein AidB-like acyl-CoA dehydrogenase